jgi:hypothetical protein
MLSIAVESQPHWAARMPLVSSDTVSKLPEEAGMAMPSITDAPLAWVGGGWCCVMAQLLTASVRISPLPASTLVAL